MVINLMTSVSYVCVHIHVHVVNTLDDDTQVIQFASARSVN